MQSRIANSRQGPNTLRIGVEGTTGRQSRGVLVGKIDAQDKMQVNLAARERQEMQDNVDHRPLV